jgi:hypothetical protein
MIFKVVKSTVSEFFKVCIKNKKKDEGLEVWLKQYSACLASTKPWVQTPVV